MKEYTFDVCFPDADLDDFYIDDKPIGYITVSKKQLATIVTRIDPYVKATTEKRQALIRSIDAVVKKITESLVKTELFLREYIFPIPDFLPGRKQKKERIDKICDKLNEMFQKLKEKIIDTKSASTSISSFKDDAYNTVLLKHYRCYQLVNKALEVWKHDRVLICIPEEGYLDALCEIVHACRKVLSTGVSIERPNVLLDAALLNILATIRRAINRQARNLLSTDKALWLIWMDGCPRRWLRTGMECHKGTRMRVGREETEKAKRKNKNVKKKGSKKKVNLLVCVDPTGKCRCSKSKSKTEQQPAAAAQEDC